MLTMQQRNPYEPPVAGLTDIAPPNTQLGASTHLPLVPRVAGILVATSFALSVIRLYLIPDWSSPLPPFIASLLFLSIGWGVTSSIRKARNWVRWIIIVFGLICLFDLPRTLANIPSGLTETIEALQTVLLVVAAILLVLPSSRHWFRRTTQA